MRAALANSSGWLRFIQSDFGIIHSAETGPLPLLLMRKAGSPLAAMSAASAAERTSIQIMAGRSGVPSWSTATTEQQVVSIASAST
jgi:hypothetical protein